MDADDKKQALRMIPYGLYVLAAESADGRVAASTVNWVTQASFERGEAVLFPMHEHDRRPIRPGFLGAVD